MQGAVQSSEIEDTDDSKSIDSVVREKKESIIPPSKSYYRMAQSGSLPERRPEKPLIHHVLQKTVSLSKLYFFVYGDSSKCVAWNHTGAFTFHQNKV